MNNVIVILAYIFGAIAAALFVIACVLCAKTLKIYGGGKNNVIAFPVALAAVSVLNTSLFVLLIIETAALAAMVVYFLSQYKTAKELASASVVSEPEPIAEEPVVVEQKAEIEAGTVIEHSASDEEEQIVAENTVEDISVEEAHNAVSDDVAAHFIDKKKSDVTRFQKKSIVNIDTLAENFESGDSVNLETLIQKGLIPKNSDYVKVLARGHLNKKLFVEANDYSADAVKMIILTGGTVTEII